MTLVDLYDRPDSFCRGSCAQTAGGIIVGFDHPSATRFDPLGALLKCYEVNLWTEKCKFTKAYIRLCRSVNDLYADATDVGRDLLGLSKWSDQYGTREKLLMASRRAGV